MTGSDLQEVPARKGRAAELRKGQHIKMVNTHGTQVIDMWALNTEDMIELMSMRHTKSCLKKMIPAVGEPFYTNRRHPILTWVEDRSPGVHDVVLPACDKWRYIWDGYEGFHDSCGNNLEEALHAIGREPPPETPQPLNLWMNCPIHDDGRIDYIAPATKPGDYSVFRAEMDCIVVMSACPYDLGMPINGDDGVPKAVHYQVW
jgi:uncharacterized protein YcgI (DUF1989 family)